MSATVTQPSLSELSGVTSFRLPKQWLRGPASVDRLTGEIVLARDRAALYQPISDRQVVFDLAAVSEPRDAVAFVQKHGLLIHGPDDAGDREPFEEFRHHAGATWLLLHLVELIRRARDDYAATRELRTIWLPKVAQAFREEGQDLRPPLDDDDDIAVIAWAADFVAAFVVERRKDQELDLVWDGEGWAEAWLVPNLIGAVYEQLAEIMLGRTPLLVCEECQQVFPVDHGRQKYCSKSCAGKARSRRWRTKGSK
jgi:hypothetical protein